MLGFTKSLLHDRPLCLVGNAGEPDADSLLMALRVSSSLKTTMKMLKWRRWTAQLCNTSLFSLSLTCCSTRWGCFPRRSPVSQQSPGWSSCPCARRAEDLGAPPPSSAASPSHQVTTTDWSRSQSNQTRHPEPASSGHWAQNGRQMPKMVQH